MIYETQYLTTNLYFLVVYSCYLELKTWKESDDLYSSTMASSVLEKFEKYWKDFIEILIIAVILDPCYKLDFYGLYLQKKYMDKRVHHKFLRSRIIISYKYLCLLNYKQVNKHINLVSYIDNMYFFQVNRVRVNLMLMLYNTLLNKLAGSCRFTYLTNVLCSCLDFLHV